MERKSFRGALAVVLLLGLAATGCGGTSANVSDIAPPNEVVSTATENAAETATPTPTFARPTRPAIPTPDPVLLCEDPLPQAEVTALLEQTNPNGTVADGWALIGVGSKCIDSWGDPGWQMYVRNQTETPIAVFAEPEFWYYQEDLADFAWAITETDDGWIQPGETALVSVTVDLGIPRAGIADLMDITGVLDVIQEDILGDVYRYYFSDLGDPFIYPIGIICFDTEDTVCG